MYLILSFCNAMRLVKHLISLEKIKADVLKGSFIYDEYLKDKKHDHAVPTICEDESAHIGMARNPRNWSDCVGCEALIDT